MKSFTDLEQSKKLAEILPIESADMFFICVGNREIIRINDNIKDYNNWDTYPAWSLAALLDVIPFCSLRRFIDGNWVVSAEFSLNGYRDSQPNKSAIDACYEMILKLHELKLI